MNVVDVDDPGAVDAVVTRLTAGEPVVIPTDTVYGLAALPGGLERVRELKRRPPDRAIPLLVADVDALDELVAGVVAGPARDLAAAFWPGPLTIVVDARAGPLVDAVSNDGTVGVRCPANGFVRAVAARVGPLPTTSANVHGEPTPSDATAVAEMLGDPGLLVVDGGTAGGEASTVVRVSHGDARSGPSVEVLRQGPIAAERLASVIGGTRPP